MRGLVILMLALAAVSAHPGSTGRIVNGELTTINRYPDMAVVLLSLPVGGFVQSCGGVIINNRSILTAAHCTTRLATSRLRSRLGSSFASTGGVEFHTAWIIEHPQYNQMASLDLDVSIMRVQGTIFFTPLIRNAQLAGRDYHVADNQVVWAAGWGRIFQGGPPSEQLRHVQIWTVNQNVCRNQWRHLGVITDNMLCAGAPGPIERGQCSQDSGGPVYHNGVVVGITSFGRCGYAQYPGVNVRVQRIADWIQQNG